MSFNAGEEISAIIDRLAAQVERIVVIDNGSRAVSLTILKRLSLEGRIELHENGENMGVAFALNRGIDRATALHARWLLTMDQDSMPASDMVQTMLGYAKDNPDAKCLSPNLLSFSTQQVVRKSGRVSYAITSGNLVNMSVFENIGEYDENYFIDCVDFEFSLRARQAGFQIHKVDNARMFHDVGEQKSVPRVVSRFYTQHSPVRRYYSFRNIMFLARKYFTFDFRFISKLVLGQFIYFVLIMIFEQQKRENWRFVCRGIRDGIMSRGGRWVETVR